jgi:beta-glucosidase-like glycosyl hydrolase/CubicO group peptidase (beta-lactamase class C family)
MSRIKLYSLFIILAISLSGISANFLAKSSKAEYAEMMKRKKKKKKKPIHSHKKKPIRRPVILKPDTIVYRKDYPQTNWAKHVFEDMSLDEKIGQLFMVAAYSNRGQDHVDAIKNLVEKYHIGGLIFFQGGPYRQAVLTNYYQNYSKVPLFIAIDGEWGLGMRLDSTLSYPKQLTLGAIQNNELIYDMGSQIAAECARIGMHINFAPVADINSNPTNPVIGFRSFGESKKNVAAKACAYMNGMQDNGIMACGKHFPGHGDTDADSHFTLPTLKHSRARLDSLELFTFDMMIDSGLQSVMVGHLNVPILDTTKNSVASVSKQIVRHVLRDSMKFKGLIFTDALDMKGVASLYKPGEVDLNALLAGNDVLLFPEDVPTAIKLIKQAFDSCIISMEEIDEHVKRILHFKEEAGLFDYQPIKKENLIQDLNSDSAKWLVKKLYMNALTLLTNKNNILPLKRLDTLNIATVVIGESINSEFQNTVDLYCAADHFHLPTKSNDVLRDSVLQALQRYNLVLVSIENATRKSENNFNIGLETVSFVHEVRECSKVILNLMANPYSLTKFVEAELLDAIIMPYEENEITEELAAELVFGGVDSPGKLPINVRPHFTIGEGIKIGKPIRNHYAMPYEIGIESSNLLVIDTIINNAIKQGAMPGCEVYAAKNGNVFLNKSYGTNSNTTNTKVQTNTLYDIASITKIASSTLSLMQLYDGKKFKLDDEFSKYLPQLKNSNKTNLTFRDQLTHQGKLKPFIPFWKETVDTTIYKNIVYQKSKDEAHSVLVADSMYMLNSIIDTVFKRILDSPLEQEKKYLYSDMGYYFVKEFVEQQTLQNLNDYVAKTYSKLGMSYTTYKPLRKFNKEEIAATENDKTFRKQLLQGYVHDQGAAMMGGVAGHAGLFSTANDLGKLMQMYLNKGEYGKENYINKNTINEFTKCQFCKEGNRRGLGFDKPEPNPKKDSPCSKSASLESFGHSGFTGTFTWADPSTGLVYVFLSNRVNPSAENKKLNELNVRTKIQDALYNALRFSVVPGDMNIIMK